MGILLSFAGPFIAFVITTGAGENPVDALRDMAMGVVGCLAAVAIVVLGIWLGGKMIRALADVIGERF
jgi:hypothetical protein